MITNKVRNNPIGDSAWSIVTAAACVLALNLTALAKDAKEAPAETKASAFAGHLEIGTRVTHFILDKDTDNNGFLGSIDHLGDQQDYAPDKVFVDWMFNPHWGVELTWDQVEAVARTKAEDDHSDGKFVLDGPILTVFGRYPNKTIFRPYAGLGAAFYMTDFEPENWWEQGFDSPESYELLGRPPGNRNNRSRNIDTDNTVGFVATAGTDIKLSKHWYADLYLRYTAVDLDAHFTLLTHGVVTDDKGTSTIPFDNFAAGAGLKYVF